MSPEVNGNPPSVTKRKKNRDKKIAPASLCNSGDMNMSNNCNYFSMNSHPCHNLSIPDMSAYYSFVNNCSNSTEPTSLPIYPMNYSNYNCSGTSNMNYLGANSTPKHGNMPYNINGDSTEYLSLPVVNLDQTVEADKRRFSDPGLPNESDSSSNSYDDRVVQKLSQHVNTLKESNRKLSREVMEMRIEMNLLKQQLSLRHSDRDYEPGMLADIIREVRDAARVREDALLARVKHLIEEKQLSLNHMHLVSEKNKNNDRIAKLEDQMKNINLGNQRAEDGVSTTTSATDEDPNSARQVLELEREALELRRELQDTRAKKEESEQKVLQLDKKLSTLLLRRQEQLLSGDVSQDGKTTSENLSISTSVSSVSHTPSRVTLSGPVTDL